MLVVAILKFALRIFLRDHKTDFNHNNYKKEQPREQKEKKNNDRLFNAIILL